MQRIKHETGGAGIDFTFDDNFNNSEDALTPETRYLELLIARTPLALEKRVAVVDRAIRNNIEWG